MNLRGGKSTSPIGTKEPADRGRIFFFKKSHPVQPGHVTVGGPTRWKMTSMFDGQNSRWSECMSIYDDTEAYVWTILVTYKNIPAASMQRSPIWNEEDVESNREALQQPGISLVAIPGLTKRRNATSIQQGVLLLLVGMDGHYYWVALIAATANEALPNKTPFGVSAGHSCFVQGEVVKNCTVFNLMAIAGATTAIS
eukprot:scaffold9345_cov120-Cylindrotheca_fusiformis.AAC.7